MQVKMDAGYDIDYTEGKVAIGDMTPASEPCFREVCAIRDLKRWSREIKALRECSRETPWASVTNREITETKPPR